MPGSPTARRSRKMTRDSWDRIIATNLTAAFDCAQAALPDLLASENGRLVFVASVAEPARRPLCRAIMPPRSMACSA